MWPAWEKTEFETGGVVSTGFPSLFTIAKWKNCKSSHRKPGTADSESEARRTPAAKADFGARPAVCEAPFLSLSGSPGPARPALPSRPCTPPPRSPSLLESCRQRQGKAVLPLDFVSLAPLFETPLPTHCALRPPCWGAGRGPSLL